MLVFHRTPDLAILVGGVVEEAAQASINAAALGGPVEMTTRLARGGLAARDDVRQPGNGTRVRMAIIHDTTMSPGKLDLLKTWMPAQSWYLGGSAPALAKAGGFRLDDPSGEVGSSPWW